MQAQQDRSAERREAEHAALQKEGVEEEEELHSAAGEEEEEASASDLEALIKALQGLQEEDTEPAEGNDSSLTTEELREQRLLERIRQQQLDAQRSWAAMGGQETLHSGAPLSETGPATVLLVLAVAGAIGETWRRVRRAERQ